MHTPNPLPPALLGHPWGVRCLPQLFIFSVHLVTVLEILKSLTWFGNFIRQTLTAVQIYSRNSMFLCNKKIFIINYSPSVILNTIRIVGQIGNVVSDTRALSCNHSNQCCMVWTSREIIAHSTMHIQYSDWGSRCYIYCRCLLCVDMVAGTHYFSIGISYIH